MKAYSATQITLAALLGIGFLLSSPAAIATDQVVVNIVYKNRWIQGTTFTIHSGTGTATLGNGTTPSVMWPAGIITGNEPVFTYTGPYTIFGSRQRNIYSLLAGTIKKSHAGAAVLTANGGGSVVQPPTTTTSCFVQPPAPAPTLPGPTLGGLCFPRYGTAIRTPGSKKYGGTARLMRDRLVVGTFTGIGPTGSTLATFARFFTPKLTGPDVFTANGGAKYGAVGVGVNYNVVLKGGNDAFTVETNAPHTTGKVNVIGNGFGTSFNLTGSHALNTANKTGSISMVKPFMRQTFNRDAAGNFVGNLLSTTAVRQIVFTFLPEPGLIALVASGALGIAGLAVARRSRR